MFSLRATSLVTGLMAASAACADGPVVVELFTSQGCSSCPPADQLLADLAQRDDVIALGLHVDYWDYIGWVDTFGSSQFTARQQGYARAAGSTVVYTPQMVIGGEHHVVGYRPMDVAELVMQHSPDDYSVEITVSSSGGEFLIRAETPDRQDMEVHVVTYLPHEEVSIGRGENAGETFDYHNIVVSWQTLGNWGGGRAFQGRIQPADQNPIVVLVQEAEFGRILGAARIE